MKLSDLLRIQELSSKLSNVNNNLRAFEGDSPIYINVESMCGGYVSANDIPGVREAAIAKLKKLRNEIVSQIEELGVEV